MIIGTVTVLLILILCGSVLFIKNRFMPKKACDRKAILNGGGKIINIEGFNIWYKILPIM